MVDSPPKNDLAAHGAAVRFGLLFDGPSYLGHHVPVPPIRLLEVPKKIEAGLPKSPYRGSIRHGGRKSCNLDTFAPKSFQKQGQGPWANPTADALGLPNHDVDIYDVLRKVGQFRRLKLLTRWMLPTEVPD